MLRLEEAQDADSVAAGHHQIEEDGRVVVAGELLDRFESVACALDLEMFAPKNALDHIADGVIVVDNQDLLGRNQLLLLRLLLGHQNLRGG